jgi:hypothetical protein
MLGCLDAIVLVIGMILLVCVLEVLVKAFVFWRVSTTAIKKATSFKEVNDLGKEIMDSVKKEEE